MPYYYWSGIDTEGQFVSGYIHARSSDDLRIYVSDRNATLVRYKEQHQWFWMLPSSKELSQFFGQLGVLVGAGVRLPRALFLTNKSVKSRALRQAIVEAHVVVDEGRSLYDAFSVHGCFNDITLALVRAGQGSGQLARTCKMLEAFYAFKAEIEQSARAALVTPVVTMSFFFGVVLVIMVCVVPRFESLIMSITHDIPPLTQFIFDTSTVLRSGLWWGLFVFVTFFFIVTCRMLRKKIAYLWGRIVLALPVVGKIVKEEALALFLQTISMLLECGVRFPDACELSIPLLSNEVLQESARRFLHTMRSGVPLSQALVAEKYLYTPELEGLLEVGQETGELDTVLAKLAQRYCDSVEQQRVVFVSLLQPLIILVLGLLIALLAVALYLPLLTLSMIVA